MPIVRHMAAKGCQARVDWTSAHSAAVRFAIACGLRAPFRLTLPPVQGEYGRRQRIELAIHSDHLDWPGRRRPKRPKVRRRGRSRPPPFALPPTRRNSPPLPRRMLGTCVPGPLMLVGAGARAAGACVGEWIAQAATSAIRPGTFRGQDVVGEQFADAFGHGTPGAVEYRQ